MALLRQTAKKGLACPENGIKRIQYIFSGKFLHTFTMGDSHGIVFPDPLLNKIKNS